KIVAEGKKILLVGTKPAARRAIQETGEETGMPYVAIRWIGGTLTNFKVINERLAMLEDLEQKKTRGEFEQYKKKEKIKLEENLRNLQKTFAGVRNLKKLPDALFVVDAIHDNLAVREAVRLNIPVVALADTNTNPALITYPIPSNDDALPAVRFMMNKLKHAIFDGKKEIKSAEAAPTMASGEAS
ncbi:30S ribosomal protein S2, partial [Patescibacteria group bacterium]|nr:30S ribosomal protein S2 [Patescibacteria group bacterium]